MNVWKCGRKMWRCEKIYDLRFARPNWQTRVNRISKIANRIVMKFIFKWLLRLFILAVVLAVIFFLSLDSILRVMVQHNIRAQTGMEAKIGKFHLGLTQPVVEIKNLQLFNSAEFGGTPFLNIPEIHVEYDRLALKKGEIHITLLRFNLGELDIVKNLAGQTNQIGRAQ